MRKKRLNSLGESVGVAEAIHLHIVEIGRLETRQNPQINQIVFQASNLRNIGVERTFETMILCTHYGLLIYETTAF